MRFKIPDTQAPLHRYLRYVCCLAWILTAACSGNKVTQVPASFSGIIKINGWTAIGPFTFDTAHQEPRNTIFNDDLSSIGLKEADVNASNAGTLRNKFPWQHIYEKDGYIDLFEYVKGEKKDKSNFYLLSSVNSEVAQDVVLSFDYAAGAMLWFNGEKIFEGHHKTGTPRKLDQFITVHLKKGPTTSC